MSVEPSRSSKPTTPPLVRPVDTIQIDENDVRAADNSTDNRLDGDLKKTGRPGTWPRLAGAVKRLPQRTRYRILMLVVVIAAAIQLAFWALYWDDATRQVMSSYYILPTTAFLVVLWWTFLSGFAWRIRLRGIFAGLVAAGAFFALFRLTEFTGDMIPQFQLRFRPSAADRAAQYWKGIGAETASDKESTTPADSTKILELPIARDDWPQFFGPNRNGDARRFHFRTNWNEQKPHCLWRHPVGSAWSSFAVVGKYAFTQEQRGKDEAVVCYDADTGKQLWAHLDANVRFSAALAGTGPRATPTVFDSRLYTLGAKGILNCFEARTGRLLWTTNINRDAGVPPLQWGMAGSPLVYGNVVVLNPGGPRKTMSGKETNGRAIIAYDRISGKQVWSGGDYQAAYASPTLAKIAGQQQIVIFDGLGVAGHDAANGKQLWRSEEWTNEFHNNIAQPIVFLAGGVFVSSGYGTGCMFFDVKKTGSDWITSRRWTAPNKFKLKFNSAVYRADCVYGLDEGILACFDLWNVKELWKKGRYKYGQLLLLADGLLVLSETGDVIVLDVSSNGSREVAKFHAIDGKTWNYPAISKNRLYVRNDEEAACYDLNPTQSASR